MGVVSTFPPLLIISIHVCEACCGTFHLVSIFPGMPTFSLSVTAEDFLLIQTPCHATSCPVFDSLLSSVSSLKASPCFHSVPQTLNLYWLTVWLLWALHLLLSHISGWILADDCFQGRLGQEFKNNSWASCAGLPSARAFGGCQPSPAWKLYHAVADPQSDHTQASLCSAKPEPAPTLAW